MSKYNTDLDYVIPHFDITEKELREIMAEANKVISDCMESKENRAVAYLKKAQCLRKLGGSRTVGFIYYEEPDNFIFRNDAGIIIETEDIKRLLKYALELSPNMPEALMQLGRLYSTDLFGNYKDQAIYLFTKAIQLKPDYAAAFNSRAMLFHPSNANNIFWGLEDKDKLEKTKENFRKAVADLTEAIRIRPFDAIYHLNRATFHSKLGEHKEAVEDFSKVLDYAQGELKKKLITEVLIFKLRGNEYLELKEYGKAIGDFSESLSFKPNDKDTLLLRAKAYYFAGEKDKTKEAFEEFLSRMHNDADTAGREKIYELTGLRPEDIL
jgi:tetratricopeptide (TPR) repeat protein